MSVFHLRIPSRLVVAHWLDSLATGLIAAAVVAGIRTMLPSMFLAVVERLSHLGVAGPYTVAFAAAFVIGVISPDVALSSFRGMMLLAKGKHLGIVAKALIGGIAYLAIIRLTSAVWVWRLEFVDILLLGVFLVPGATGWLMEWLTSNPKTEEPSEGNLEGSDPWLEHDAPISCSQECKFLEHKEVAQRLLARLLAMPDEAGRLPNVALIGAYGSGKTGICNLVKEHFHGHFNSNKDLPDTIICRFEAWQYREPEAALGGLVSILTSAVLSRVDAAELWQLPNQYLAALSKGAGSWGTALSSVIEARPAPKDVLARMGKVLKRVGLRLLVYVDDLDRIEESAPSAQRAITVALNQLQEVPCVQYVIAIGPSPPSQADSSSVRPAYDLLKLTRFQEFVPRLNHEFAINLILQLRDSAFDASSNYYPWADNSNKLAQSFGYLARLGRWSMHPLSRAIMELLDTPRSLKAALRETDAAWRNGLNGEVNWYDLFVVCALKTAEPSLFEWIERNRETVVYGTASLGQLPQGDQAKNERSDRLTSRVRSLLSRLSSEREKAVIEAIRWLFPAFAQAISDSSLADERIEESDQRIACTLGDSMAYFERFLFGMVFDNNVPDQPVLRYIRRISDNPLDQSKFESLFLDTIEKRNGDLEKLVQFADLLPVDQGLRVCRIIVAWCAEAEHAGSCQEGSRQHFSTMFRRVVSILERCGKRDNKLRQERHLTFHNEKSSKVLKWAKEIVDEFACTRWVAPWSLIGHLKQLGLGTEGVHELWSRMAEQLVKKYVCGTISLADAMSSSFGLNREFLRLFGKHPCFGTHRKVFSQKVVSEADNDKSLLLRSAIIFSLLEPIQANPEDAVLTGVEYHLERKSGERLYDMSIIVPALKRWKSDTPPDDSIFPLLEKLLDEYGPSGDAEADGEESV